MRHKTTKSVTKRFKVTKNGKLIHRPMGTDHFKTKKTKKARRQKRNQRVLSYPSRKITNY